MADRIPSQRELSALSERPNLPGDDNLRKILLDRRHCVAKLSLALFQQVLKSCSAYNSLSTASQSTKIPPNVLFSPPGAFAIIGIIQSGANASVQAEMEGLSAYGLSGFVTEEYSWKRVIDAFLEYLLWHKYSALRFHNISGLLAHHFEGISTISSRFQTRIQKKYHAGCLLVEYTKQVRPKLKEWCSKNRSEYIQGLSEKIDHNELEMLLGELEQGSLGCVLLNIAYFHPFWMFSFGEFVRETFKISSKEEVIIEMMQGERICRYACSLDPEFSCVTVGVGLGDDGGDLIAYFVLPIEPNTLEHVERQLCSERFSELLKRTSNWNICLVRG